MKKTLLFLSISSVIISCKTKNPKKSFTVADKSGSSGLEAPVIQGSIATPNIDFNQLSLRATVFVYKASYFSTTGRTLKSRSEFEAKISSDGTVLFDLSGFDPGRHSASSYRLSATYKGNSVIISKGTSNSGASFQAAEMLSVFRAAIAQLSIVEIPEVSFGLEGSVVASDGSQFDISSLSASTNSDKPWGVIYHIVSAIDQNGQVLDDCRYGRFDNDYKSVKFSHATAKFAPALLLCSGVVSDKLNLVTNVGISFYTIETLLARTNGENAPYRLDTINLCHSKSGTYNEITRARDFAGPFVLPGEEQKCL